MLNKTVHRRIVFFTLLPLALLSIILSTYFTNKKVNDLDEVLKSRGESLSMLLATASSYSVTKNHLVILNRLISSILKEPDVIAATIVNNEGSVMTREQDPGHESITPQTIGKILNDDNVIFMQPIYAYFDPAESNSAQNNPGKKNIVGWAIIELSKMSTRNEQFLTQRNSVLLTAIMLGISILLVYGISRYVTNPIKKAVRCRQ